MSTQNFACYKRKIKIFILFCFFEGILRWNSTFSGGVRPHTTIFLSPHAPCDRRVEAKGEAFAKELVLRWGYELEGKKSTVEVVCRVSCVARARASEKKKNYRTYELEEKKVR